MYGGYVFGVFDVKCVVGMYGDLYFVIGDFGYVLCEGLGVFGVEVFFGLDD